MTTNDPTPQVLTQGQMLPAFTLPSTDGTSRSPWEYKQRQHLVLLFTQSASLPGGRALLQTFAHAYASFREQRCSILAITADTVIENLKVQEELHLPFPLLANPTGNIIQHYTYWDEDQKRLNPAIIVADLYGAIHTYRSARSEAQLPPLSEIQQAVLYLDTACTL